MRHSRNLDAGPASPFFLSFSFFPVISCRFICEKNAPSGGLEDPIEGRGIPRERECGPSGIEVIRLSFGLRFVLPSDDRAEFLLAHHASSNDLLFPQTTYRAVHFGRRSLPFSAPKGRWVPKFFYEVIGPPFLPRSAWLNRAGVAFGDRRERSS